MILSGEDRCVYIYMYIGGALKSETFDDYELFNRAYCLNTTRRSFRRLKLDKLKTHHVYRDLFRLMDRRE